MPGMMDTVLNLGMNDKSVEGLAKVTENPRFAWDSYRRFIQMFGDVVLGISKRHFDTELERIKNDRGAKHDTELSQRDLEKLV